jgi:hypothetical protein
MPTEYSVSLYGLNLDVSVSHAYSEPSTQHANGYSELDWVFVGGTDEIGQPISFKSLDFIKKEYESEINGAIWAQIERVR